MKKNLHSQTPQLLEPGHALERLEAVVGEVERLEAAVCRERALGAFGPGGGSFAVEGGGGDEAAQPGAVRLQRVVEPGGGEAPAAQGERAQRGGVHISRAEKGGREEVEGEDRKDETEEEEEEERNERS